MRQRTANQIKTGSTKQPKAHVEPTSGARLRYWFDGTMARGTPALVAWLAVVTLVLIVVFTAFITVMSLDPGAPNAKDGFFGQLLATFFHALDPGTVAGDSGSWRYIVTMLALTVAGLFIVSALIGVIATGIDDKLAELRRGRSLVIERDHTVILGWSDSVFAIVRELSIANESRRKPAVVILADEDKVVMEDAIREKVADLKGTRVVCRTGSVLDIGDLALTNHGLARSIIVLSPGGDEPDSEVIKTLLALTHDGAGPHIVAEIQDPENLEAARLVGGRRTVIVDKRETIARLIVQTSRQSGAAAVYTELFDFDGDEIYFHSDASLSAGPTAMRSRRTRRRRSSDWCRPRVGSSSTRRWTSPSAAASWWSSPRTTRSSPPPRARPCRSTSPASTPPRSATRRRPRCSSWAGTSGPRRWSASSTTTPSPARRCTSSPSSARPTYRRCPT